MKNSTILNSNNGNQMSALFLLLLITLLPTIMKAQEYRNINAYIDDF